MNEADIEMIREEEVEIVGNWIEVDGRVVGDDACKRVQILTQDYLEKIGQSPESGGWETLFRDPKDGRFWVQTYPQSEMHGGGPASLTCLAADEAKKRFPHLFVLS